MPSSVKVWEISRGLSDKIGLLRRPKKRSSLRPILRESVFPEDLIGSKSSLKTYSLVEYALKKTYFKGLEKISLELDLFSSPLRRPILLDSPLLSIIISPAPSIGSISRFVLGIANFAQGFIDNRTSISLKSLS